MTRGADWFGRDPRVSEYVRERMASFDTAEFVKVFAATYRFERVPLERIDVPTLVLNGEGESEAVSRHAPEFERVVPDCRVETVPDAGHTSNMENPTAFDSRLREFLDAL